MIRSLRKLPVLPFSAVNGTDVHRGAAEGGEFAQRDLS